MRNHSIEEVLEAMKERPAMWFWSNAEADQIVQLTYFMLGYEQGTDAPFDFMNDLSKHLNLGSVPASSKDVSLGDALDFALGLVRKAKECATPSLP